MGSNETQRPWYDVRTFLHFMGKQAERIGLVFSRGQPRQSRRRRFLGRRKQSTPSATPRPAASSSNKLRRKEQESRIFDQVHERPEFNAPRDIAGKRLQIPPQTADGENGIPKGRQSVVINNKTQDGTRVQVGQVPLVHSEASKASYSKLPAGDETGFEATTNDGTGVDQMNSSDERVPSSRYALTEPLTRGYSPPQPRDDDDEFTSKAVMVKDSTGKEKAVKLFFDSMSADNWISEPFANAFGFELRPILPRDMKVYRTVCSEEFVPTRYVELQLQDDSLMEDFTTLRCNVTRSMHGIGLIAGRLFMKEHNVVVNPNASRDIFVVTSRKGNDGKFDRRYMCKISLTVTQQRLKMPRVYC